jgi:hypothetical protein
MAFFITLGALLILIGALICRSYRIKYARYKGVTAEVLGYRSDFRMHGDEEVEYYCVVVNYNNNGEDVRADHDGYVPADTVTVQRGDSVSVRIDPMVPDKFLFTDEIKGTSSFGSGLVIGGALTVAFHLLSELLFK